MFNYPGSGHVHSFFESRLESSWWSGGLSATANWRGLISRYLDGSRDSFSEQPFGVVETTELAPEPAAAPSDPLFGSQWSLLNTGQTGGTPGIDINVVDVWDDYSGAGVVIGVVDTGVQYTHPDLAANYDTTIDFDAAAGDNDPLASGSENHSTAVSGTIAAVAENGIGVSGVAPGATVAGFRMSFGSGTLPQIEANLALQAGVDISNNSWSYNGFFFDNFESSTFQAAGDAIENAVMTGRGGLGTVFVFAAGNGRSDGQDVGYHSFQNSPYTIAVAAIDDDGIFASFSNPGAALLVSAPGVSILTTDRTGGDGYVAGDYVSISGTSFSAPTTAGVIALMLEANPDLGYRDVQEILAYSARQVDAGSSGWATNGANNWNGGGLHVSHDYGFGLVDALAAVRLAETWQGVAKYDNQVSVSATSSPFSGIPDLGSVNDTITIASGVMIDYVGVTLDIDHSWIGDLVVTLTSPDGTESVLVNRPGKNPNSASGFGTSQNDINATIYSTNDWGETGVGEWTLTVEDQAGGISGRLNSWTLTLYGDPITGDDLYIFTDEFSDFAGAGYLLGDAGGDDILNAAAVTGDSFIDLAPGAANNIDGQSFGIAAGTVIETAYGGDGNDEIHGNDADNSLGGGRGSDTLYGAGGDDSLEGGYGSDFLFGGPGSDSAIFAGNVGDFDIVFGGSETTVTDLNFADGDEGTDSLTGFDSLVFADAVVPVSTTPVVNEAPTAIGLDNSTLDENDAGAVIGTLTVSDPNAGDTHGLSVDDGRFEVVGGVLRLISGVSLNSEAEPSVTIDVTATDQGGLSVTESFILTVNDLNDGPTLGPPISDTATDEDAAFVYDISGNFDDEDLAAGDSLAFTATLAGGAALPAWLGLDAGTGIFSGTPDNGDVDVLDIEVTATDGQGASVADSFQLTVNNTNDAPLVDQGIGDQSIEENVALSFSLPAGAFSDDDLIHGDLLSLSAEQADGTALPAWLSFNPATGGFSGTPGSADVGTLMLRVTAEDLALETVSTTFDIEVTQAFVNSPPIVDLGIANQSTDEDAGFNFMVPANAFDDPDIALGDSLSYSASLADDTPLPAWLGFDAVTRTFSGTPENSDVGTIAVKVTATDESSASIATNFDLTVDNTNDTPVVAAVISDTASDEDAAFLYDVSGNFTDDDLIHGDSLTFGATLVGGGALPAWLGFDSSTGIFSGTPDNGDVDVLDIEVTATDGQGASTSSSFQLTIDNTNDDPTLGPPISDTTTDEDAAFVYDISGNFDDEDLVNGDSLAFTATLVGGGALPAWLGLDAGTGIFSGTPDNGDVDVLDIEVTATDGQGASVVDSFQLTVNNINDAPLVDQGITDQSIEENTALSFSLPADAFSDDDLIHGDVLSLSAEQADGTALPAWLSFDPATATFSGTPGSGDVGTIALRVIAADLALESVSTTFDLTVDPLNTGPITLNGTAGPDDLDASGSAIPHIINGLGGGDTLTGSSADDSLNGGSGNDTLWGVDGDDLLYGGTGNDVFTGGAGRDSFIWQAGEGGSGGKNAGIEVTETITDFTVDFGDPGNNDALDLSALLTTGNPGNDHIRFQVTDVNSDGVDDTRIEVDYNGQSGFFDNSFSPTLQIDLESIDLFAAYGIAQGNNEALIDQMVANANLIV